MTHALGGCSVGHESSIGGRTNWTCILGEDVVLAMSQALGGKD